MKMSNFFLIASFLLLLSGCHNEELIKDSKPVGSRFLVATIEGQDYVDASRTAVDDSGNVTWIVTDELGVYGNVSENVKYTSTGSGSDVTFIGDLPVTEEAQWAYYPYDENASLDEDKLTITLPDNYTYTGNSNAPMLGKSLGNDKFSFKHLGGLIRFTLGGGIPDNADRFVIASVEEQQPIAGQASFAVEVNNVTMSITSDGKQSISYDVSSIKEVEEFQHFFVPLPVGDYSKLQVSFYKKDSDSPVFTRSLSNLKVGRAEMICMPILDWNTGKQYKLSENTTDITDLVEDGVTVTLQESDNSLQLVGLDENKIPETGQIIWSQPTEELPYGFMGKVKEATLSDGTVTITTETVALDEAFDELLIEESVSLVPIAESRTGVIDLDESYRIPIFLQKMEEGYDIQGELTIGTRFLSTIHINKEKKINRMNFSLQLGTEINAGMILEAKFNEDGDAIGPFELEEFKFPPVPLGGGVVVVCPAIQFKLHLEPSGSIKLTTGVNYASKCVVGTEYYNGNWEYGINKVNNDEHSPWDVENIQMKGNLFLGAGTECKFKLYNNDNLKFYIEPKAGINLSGELEINPKEEYFQETLKDLYLTSKNLVYASVGFDAKILDDQAALEIDLPVKEWGEKQIYLLPMFENLAAHTRMMTSRSSNHPFEATITMTGSREILTKYMEVSFMVEDMVENYKNHSKEIVKYEVMGGGKTSQEFSTIFTDLNPRSNYRAYPIVMSPILGEELHHQLELTEQYVSFHSPAIDLRNKLVALYHATGGENWTNNENWLSDRPIEEWYGIHDNGEGKYYIDLRNNNLTGSFDLSSSDIHGIDISENKIEHLSLDGCSGLENLYYNNNPLITLDLSNCPVVSGYYSMGDESTYSLIKHLRMSNCKDLTGMFIEMPLLESLDLSGCEKLKDIPSLNGNGYGNRLTVVNVSGCKEITDLSSLDNIPLTYLNISGCNKITNLGPLSVGQPHLIEELYAAGCTGLTGQVGIYPAMRIVDLENCTGLESVGLHGNGNDDYQLTTLNVKGCSSMKSVYTRGIYLQKFNMEGCTQLKELHVYLSDDFTNIDLSENTQLETIEILGKQLQSLDVTSCTLLKDLSFGGSFTTIDLSNNRELEYLNTSHSLTELDLTYNHELRELHCPYTKIKSLDLADKAKLEIVQCQTSQLEFLDVRGCYSLKSLDCSSNQLTVLDISDCDFLERLSCNNNQLTILDLKKKEALVQLFCYDNSISELELTDCQILADLRCDNNPIKTLDVSNRTSLEYISCSNPVLESLDVSGCSKITGLWLTDCPNLSSLDFTGCISISDMYLNGTGLSQIGLNGMASLTEFNCSQNMKLTALDFTGCTNLQVLDCGGNPQLADLVLMSHAPLSRISFVGTKVTHEIPDWFPKPNPSAGIYFTYEQRYTDYEWVTNSDGTRTLTYTDNGYGWWYPGEPAKGIHSRD